MVIFPQLYEAGLLRDGIGNSATQVNLLCLPGLSTFEANRAPPVPWHASWLADEACLDDCTAGVHHLSCSGPHGLRLQAGEGTAGSRRHLARECWTGQQ